MVEPTQFPRSVRFGGDTAGTLHEYMYGAVHEAGRDTQAKVARRPRNWIPQKVDARILCMCPTSAYSEIVSS